LFVDARTLPSDERIGADICVVGAGAAGIALALELGGQGRRVVLAESGGLQADRQAEDLNKGESIGLAYKVQETRSRFFGGTTNIWGGACRPLDETDFARRGWMAHSGWPIELADLLPYYKRARPYFELPADEDKLLPFPWSAPWQSAMWEGSPTRFGERYRSALEQLPGVTVLLNANLLALCVSPEGAIAKARFGSFGEKRLSVAARHYVLACGGLENARLLLIATHRAGGGAMNGHDLIGRFFMEHPAVRIGYLVHDHPGTPEAIYFDRGGHSFRLTAASQREAQVGAAGAYPLGPFKLDEVPVLEAELGGEKDSLLKRLARSIVRGRSSCRRHRPLSAIQLVFEQSPDPASRVTLGDERDAFGLPRLRLDWRLNALDRNTYATAARLLLKQTSGMGCGRFWMRPALRGIDFERPETIPLDQPRAHDLRLMPYDPHTEIMPSNHHMGTTRMHVDPHQGVVDPRGRVHGSRNLYVAGSSIFPTGGISNPTFTIVALALRLADHLKNGA
jgi:choline dehydrogenase-like flavoprotein